MFVGSSTRKASPREKEGGKQRATRSLWERSSGHAAIDLIPEAQVSKIPKRNEGTVTKVDTEYSTFLRGPRRGQRL